MRASTTFGLAAASFGLIATSALGATFFSDVPANSWYYNAVQWASQDGVMTGPSNMPGKFDPDGVVNRAQLATTLARMHNIYVKDINDLQVRLGLLESAWEDRFGPLKANSSSSGRSSSRASSSSSSFVGIRLFNAMLNGEQETPSVTTNAAGQGTFQLTDNDLQYDITVSGLSSSLSGAHFHRGALGVAGDVVEPITFTGNRASAIWLNMTQQEMDDLLAGRLYVNVHTANFPNGEIRGQVLAASASSSSRSSSSFSSSSSSFSLSSSSMSSSSVSSSSSSSSL